MDCAVKEISSVQISNKEIASFLDEAHLMQRLKPHKNVVLFIGVSIEPLAIVTEFCDNGSLKYVFRFFFFFQFFFFF